MRLHDLFYCAPLVALGFAGCTQDNPSFGDCSHPGECQADETGGTGDGDGDPGDGDGDGDGEPGDGDGEPGDGDGEPGDGDGEPGDGDGEPEPGPLDMLPACPETMTLTLPLVEDTFLVDQPYIDGHCVTGWDFEQDQAILSTSPLACKYLDFGGTPVRPVCSGLGCVSVWLGRFEVEVEGWAELAPQVVGAQIHFNAWTNTNVPSPLTLVPLLPNNVDPNLFGDCLDWQAGPELGEEAADCVTTWTYSAKPSTWSLDWFNADDSLGTSAVPVGAMALRHISIPLATYAAQAWFDASSHPGVVLHSNAPQPSNFMLLAQESEQPPTLEIELCKP